MRTRKLAIIVMGITFATVAGASNNVGTIAFVPSSGDYEEAFGAGFYHLSDDPVGGYINFATTLREREPHYDNLNVNSFGDPISKRFKELTVVNVGLTRSLTDHFAVYAGVGYGWGQAKARKEDPTGILGNGDSTYYVDDPANDDDGVNLNAGIMAVTPIGLTLEAGYHTFPSAAHVAIGWSF